MFSIRFQICWEGEASHHLDKQTFVGKPKD